MPSDDVDSGSLPNVSPIISLPKSRVIPKSGIAKGDIVWAKYKNLYWPALVRAIYPKEKKITIWYTDQPGKTFKLPFKNVTFFHDPKMREKIQKDATEAGCLRKHVCVTSHAERYLRRRAAGNEDDPLDFFSQTYPLVLIEPIPPMYLNPENKPSVCQKTSAKEILLNDSKVESTESQKANDKKNLLNDYEVESTESAGDADEDSASKLSKKDFEDEIIQIILSGKADNYLKQLYSESDISQLLEPLTCPGYSDSRGPVGFIKLKKIITHLLVLKNSVNDISRTNSMSEHGSVKCIYYPRKIVTLEYLLKKWLPESIIYAISVIKNISLSEAKEVLYESNEGQGSLTKLDNDNNGKGVSSSSNSSVVETKKRQASKQSADTKASFSKKRKYVDPDHDIKIVYESPSVAKHLNISRENSEPLDIAVSVKNIAKFDSEDEDHVASDTAKAPEPVNEAGSVDINTDEKCEDEDNDASETAVKRIMVSIKRIPKE